MHSTNYFEECIMSYPRSTNIRHDLNTDILSLVSLMCFLKLTYAVSYTSFNISALIFSYITMPTNVNINRVLAVNSIALQLTFYATSYLIDTSFLPRMNAKLNIPQYAFFLGDFMVHFLPSAICIFNLLIYSRSTRQQPTISYLKAAICSVSLNIVWALLNVPYFFNLDNIYVPMSNYQWATAWGTSIALHLGTARTLHILHI